MADQAIPPTFILGLLNALRPMIEQRARDESKRHSKEWLNAQPWYRDLNNRVVFGSGSMADAMKEHKLGLGVYGNGGYDNGLLEGGGGLSYTVPLDRNSTMTLSGGGGGASGTVQTPKGSRQLGEFFPEAAISYRRTF